MNITFDGEEIFCDKCNVWIKRRTNTHLEGETVKCGTCDARVGYTWDRPDIYGGKDD